MFSKINIDLSVIKKTIFFRTQQNAHTAMLQQQQQAGAVAPPPPGGQPPAVSSGFTYQEKNEALQVTNIKV